MVILQLEEQPPLIQAVFSGELDTVKKLLEAKQDVNYQDFEKRSALHAAAYRGDPAITELLIEHGARVNTKDCRWVTPLHRACCSGSEETVSILLKNQADTGARDRLWQTPLHIAAAYNSLECVQYLFERVQNPNVTDRSGRTALHHAVLNGHNDIVELLISKGCIVNACDKKDCRPLHWAAYKGHTETIEILLQNGADINAKDRNQYTPLHVAAASGSVCVIQTLVMHGALIEAQNAYGNTPLHISCLNGHGSCTQELIRHNANKEAINYRGQTPLHIAAASTHGVHCLNMLVGLDVNINRQSLDGRTALHMTAIHGRFTRSKTLIDNGAIVDSIDKNGCTALHIAAQYGHELLSSTLLAYGADPSKKGYEGRTPLHMCCLSGYIECCRIFIKAGIDLNSKDNLGKTPLHCAAYKGAAECVDLLVSSGSNIKASDNLGRIPLHYAAAQGYFFCVFTLVGNGSNPNSQDNEGCTALHLAAAYDIDGKCVNYLLEHKADPKMKDLKDFTSIHYAVAGNNINALKFLLIAIGNVCLYGSNMPPTTPLHIAAKNGNMEILETLMPYFPDPNIRNEYGCTPLLLAARQGYANCVQMLLRFGAKVSICDSIAGLSPVHHSAKNGYVHCLALLVDNTEDKGIINKPDDLLRTALMLAVSNLHTDCVTTLLKSGADPNVLDNDRHSCLFRAVVTGQHSVLHMLLPRSTVANSPDVNGKTILHVAAACGRLACIHRILPFMESNISKGFDKENFTALHWACYSGNNDCVAHFIKEEVFDSLEGNPFSAIHCAASAGSEKCLDILCKRFGSDTVKLKDVKQRIPLHVAALNGHSDCALYLVEQGSGIDCKDEDGRTPLMAAAMNGQTQVMEILIGYKADKTAYDNNGNTALHLACLKKHNHAALLLLEFIDDSVIINMINNERKTPLHLSARNGLVDVTRQLISKGSSVLAVDANGLTPALCCAPNPSMAQCLAIILASHPMQVHGANCKDIIYELKTLRSSIKTLLPRPKKRKRRNLQTDITMVQNPDRFELEQMFDVKFDKTETELEFKDWMGKVYVKFDNKDAEQFGGPPKKKHKPRSGSHHTDVTSYSCHELHGSHSDMSLALKTIYSEEDYRKLIKQSVESLKVNEGRGGVKYEPKESLSRKFERRICEPMCSFRYDVSEDTDNIDSLDSYKEVCATLVRNYISGLPSRKAENVLCPVRSPKTTNKRLKIKMKSDEFTEHLEKCSICRRFNHDVLDSNPVHEPRIPLDVMKETVNRVLSKKGNSTNRCLYAFLNESYEINSENAYMIFHGMVSPSCEPYIANILNLPEGAVEITESFDGEEKLKYWVKKTEVDLRDRRLSTTRIQELKIRSPTRNKNEKIPPKQLVRPRESRELRTEVKKPLSRELEPKSEPTLRSRGAIPKRRELRKLPAKNVTKSISYNDKFPRHDNVAKHLKSQELILPPQRRRKDKQKRMIVSTFIDGSKVDSCGEHNVAIFEEKVSKNQIDAELLNNFPIYLNTLTSFHSNPLFVNEDLNDYFRCYPTYWCVPDATKNKNEDENDSGSDIESRSFSDSHFLCDQAGTSSDVNEDEDVSVIKSESHIKSQSFRKLRGEFPPKLKADKEKASKEQTPTDIKLNRDLHIRNLPIIEINSSSTSQEMIYFNENLQESYSNTNVLNDDEIEELEDCRRLDDGISDSDDQIEEIVNGTCTLKRRAGVLDMQSRPKGVEMWAHIAEEYLREKFKLQENKTVDEQDDSSSQSSKKRLTINIPRITTSDEELKWEDKRRRKESRELDEFRIEELKMKEGKRFKDDSEVRRLQRKGTQSGESEDGGLQKERKKFQNEERFFRGQDDAFESQGKSFQSSEKESPHHRVFQRDEERLKIVERGFRKECKGFQNEEKEFRQERKKFQNKSAFQDGEKDSAREERGHYWEDAMFQTEQKRYQGERSRQPREHLQRRGKYLQDGVQEAFQKEEGAIQETEAYFQNDEVTTSKNQNEERGHSEKETAERSQKGGKEFRREEITFTAERRRSQNHGGGLGNEEFEKEARGLHRGEEVLQGKETGFQKKEREVVIHDVDSGEENELHKRSNAGCCQEKSGITRRENKNNIELRQNDKKVEVNRLEITKNELGTSKNNLETTNCDQQLKNHESNIKHDLNRADVDVNKEDDPKNGNDTDLEKSGLDIIKSFGPQSSKVQHRPKSEFLKEIVSSKSATNLEVRESKESGKANNRFSLVEIADDSKIDTAKNNIEKLFEKELKAEFELLHNEFETLHEEFEIVNEQDAKTVESLFRTTSDFTESSIRVVNVNHRKPSIIEFDVPQWILADQSQDSTISEDETLKLQGIYEQGALAQNLYDASSDLISKSSFSKSEDTVKSLSKEKDDFQIVETKRNEETFSESGENQAPIYVHAKLTENSTKLIETKTNDNIKSTEEIEDLYQNFSLCQKLTNHESSSQNLHVIQNLEGIHDVDAHDKPESAKIFCTQSQPSQKAQTDARQEYRNKKSRKCPEMFVEVKNKQTSDIRGTNSRAENEGRIKRSEVVKSDRNVQHKKRKLPDFQRIEKLEIQRYESTEKCVSQKCDHQEKVENGENYANRKFDSHRKEKASRSEKLDKLKIEKPKSDDNFEFLKTLKRETDQFDGKIKNNKSDEQKLCNPVGEDGNNICEKSSKSHQAKQSVSDFIPPNAEEELQNVEFNNGRDPEEFLDSRNSNLTKNNLASDTNDTAYSESKNLKPKILESPNSITSDSKEIAVLISKDFKRSKSKYVRDSLNNYKEAVTSDLALDSKNTKIKDFQENNFTDSAEIKVVDFNVMNSKERKMIPIKELKVTDSKKRREERTSGSLKENEQVEENTTENTYLKETRMIEFKEEKVLSHKEKTSLNVADFHTFIDSKERKLAEPIEENIVELKEGTISDSNVKRISELVTRKELSIDSKENIVSKDRNVRATERKLRERKVIESKEKNAHFKETITEGSKVSKESTGYKNQKKYYPKNKTFVDDGNTKTLKHSKAKNTQNFDVASKDATKNHENASMDKIGEKSTRNNNNTVLDPQEATVDALEDSDGEGSLNESLIVHPSEQSKYLDLEEFGFFEHSVGDDDDDDDTIAEIQSIEDDTTRGKKICFENVSDFTLDSPNEFDFDDHTVEKVILNELSLAKKYEENWNGGGSNGIEKLTVKDLNGKEEEIMDEKLKEDENVSNRGSKKVMRENKKECLAGKVDGNNNNKKESQKKNAHRNEVMSEEDKEIEVSRNVCQESRNPRKENKRRAQTREEKNNLNENKKKSLEKHKKDDNTKGVIESKLGECRFEPKGGKLKKDTKNKEKRVEFSKYEGLKVEYDECATFNIDDAIQGKLKQPVKKVLFSDKVLILNDDKKEVKKIIPKLKNLEIMNDEIDPEIIELSIKLPDVSFAEDLICQTGFCSENSNSSRINDSDDKSPSKPNSHQSVDYSQPSTSYAANDAKTYSSSKNDDTKDFLEKIPIEKLVDSIVPSPLVHTGEIRRDKSVKKKFLRNGEDKQFSNCVQYETDDSTDYEKSDSCKVDSGNLMKCTEDFSSGQEMSLEYAISEDLVKRDDKEISRNTATKINFSKRNAIQDVPDQNIPIKMTETEDEENRKSEFHSDDDHSGWETCKTLGDEDTKESDEDYGDFVDVKEWNGCSELPGRSESTKCESKTSTVSKGCIPGGSKKCTGSKVSDNCYELESKESRKSIPFKSFRDFFDYRLEIENLRQYSSSENEFPTEINASRETIEISGDSGDSNNNSIRSRNNSKESMIISKETSRCSVESFNNSLGSSVVSREFENVDSFDEPREFFVEELDEDFKTTEEFTENSDRTEENTSQYYSVGNGVQAEVEFFSNSSKSVFESSQLKSTSFEHHHPLVIDVEVFYDTVGEKSGKIFGHQSMDTIPEERSFELSDSARSELSKRTIGSEMTGSRKEKVFENAVLNLYNSASANQNKKKMADVGNSLKQNDNVLEERERNLGVTNFNSTGLSEDPFLAHRNKSRGKNSSKDSRENDTTITPPLNVARAFDNFLTEDSVQYIKIIKNGDTVQVFDNTEKFKNYNSDFDASQTTIVSASFTSSSEGILKPNANSNTSPSSSMGFLSEEMNFSPRRQSQNHMLSDIEEDTDELNSRTHDSCDESRTSNSSNSLSEDLDDATICNERSELCVESKFSKGDTKLNKDNKLKKDFIVGRSEITSSQLEKYLCSEDEDLISLNISLNATRKLISDAMLDDEDTMNIEDSLSEDEIRPLTEDRATSKLPDFSEHFTTSFGENSKNLKDDKSKNCKKLRKQDQEKQLLQSQDDNETTHSRTPDDNTEMTNSTKREEDTLTTESDPACCESKPINMHIDDSCEKTNERTEPNDSLTQTSDENVSSDISVDVGSLSVAESSNDTSVSSVSVEMQKAEQPSDDSTLSDQKYSKVRAKKTFPSISKLGKKARKDSNCKIT